MKTVEVEVQLRRKNQLTLPEAIAERLHVQPGDRLIMEIDEENPRELRVRPLLKSYAGILKGMYGTPEEAAEYLRQERASWEE
jgi:bifunctional DNA-binding transcriptional regulator/antitoxin component of YhaV-PrlF toxin-antitoxin module